MFGSLISSSLSNKCLSTQGSAKTKEDAEKAFQDTKKLDNEVNDMMGKLSAAEQELAEKKAAADQDMMMAGMVRTAATLFYQ